MSSICLRLPWPPSVAATVAKTWPPPTPGVYRFVDVPTGKFYIGSTANLRLRYRTHLWSLRNGRHANCYLQRIYDKRAMSLIFEVIEDVLPGRDFLLAAEQKWLDKTFEHPLCINFLKTAGSRLGTRHSRATIKKMSDAKLGVTHSAETREKMRAAKIGGKLTSEHKRKIALKSKGRPGPKHTAVNLAKWRKISMAQSQSAFVMRQAGLTLQQIANTLGIGRSTANRILRKESYVD